MIRFFLFLSCLVQITYANSEKYFIKFGSFKNLQGLEKSIAKLPNELRLHVVIVRSNSWYIPFAYYTSNKQALTSKVAGYKRYFKDAKIAHSTTMLSHPLVRNYATEVKKESVVSQKAYVPPVNQSRQALIQYAPPVRRVAPKFQNVAISEDDNTMGYVQPSTPQVMPPIATSVAQTIPVTPIIETQKIVRKQQDEEDVFSNVKPKKYKNFSKQMLSGQYYYLAYKKTQSNPNLLIKVSFGNHDVTYQPVIGDMTMTKANYLTEDNKLYMFTDSFTRNGSFSKLEEHRDDHFLVSSWANGKKLNTLRYYYKMNDAKKYLGLHTSDGLAEILSEGGYDDFFLNE